MQNLIVALIVLAAGIYSSWRLMPAVLRQQLARRSATLLRRLGASEQRAGELAEKIAAGAGCGDCGPCKSCSTGSGNTENTENAGKTVVNHAAQGVPAPAELSSSDHKIIWIAQRT